MEQKIERYPYVSASNVWGTAEQPKSEGKKTVTTIATVSPEIYYV